MGQNVSNTPNTNSNHRSDSSSNSTPSSTTAGNSSHTDRTAQEQNDLQSDQSTNAQKSDVKAQETPTGAQASVNYPGGEASPNAERQGEVAVNKSADTHVVGGPNGGPEDDAKTNEQNMEDAKADGLRNAAREREAQPREAGGKSDREDSKSSRR